MKPIHLCIFFATFLAACANTGASYTPILDGAPNASFHHDLMDCQSLARNQRQLDRETVTAAVIGAGAGAVLGHADDDGNSTGGAIAGVLGGAAAGVVNASKHRKEIVVECLRGRGHRVVG